MHREIYRHHNVWRYMHWCQIGVKPSATNIVHVWIVCVCMCVCFCVVCVCVCTDDAIRSLLAFDLLSMQGDMLSCLLNIKIKCQQKKHQLNWETVTTILRAIFSKATISINSCFVLWSLAVDPIKHFSQIISMGKCKKDVTIANALELRLSCTNPSIYCFRCHTPTCCPSFQKVQFQLDSRWRHIDWLSSFILLFLIKYCIKITLEGNHTCNYKTMQSK